jgi:hypothetical protein
MGEARRNRDLLPLAECSADIVWPGDEAKLLKATGAHAARQRAALAKALSDLVLRRNRCSACERGYESLDDLGCIVVAYIKALGRELPTSPSFTICQHCLSTEKPTVWADKMVHSFLAAQSNKPRLVKS